MGTDSTSIAEPQTAPVPLSRTEALERPKGSERYLVRSEKRHPLADTKPDTDVPKTGGAGYAAGIVLAD